MRAKHLIVFFAFLWGYFLVLASGADAGAQAQTQPAAATQKTEPTSPELTEADQLSLEVVKLYQAAKYDEALPLAKRALRLTEKALGENHLRVADALTNVAEIYVIKGKGADAEPLFRRALAIHDKNPTSNGLLTGKILDHLAALRLANADVKKAEELYRRAVAVKEQAVGPDHAEVVFSMDRLADFYTGQKDYAKARLILQQVASLKEKAYGNSHQEVGRALERLACAMYRNNEKAESEKVEARANQILYSEMAKRTQPLFVSAAMFECKIITNPRPEFPAAAKGRSGGEFHIMTAVDVDESGNVISATFVSGDPAFRRSAEQAALKAKFRPVIVDGRPVRFKGILRHTFSVMTSVILVPGVGRP